MTQRKNNDCEKPSLHLRQRCPRAREAASGEWSWTQSSGPEEEGGRGPGACGPRGSPILEPPGVPPSVPAVVVVGTRVALATEAGWLRALLGLVAAQHEVGVWKTGVHTDTNTHVLTVHACPQQH